MSATLTVLGAGSILPRTGYGCAGYALRPGPGEPVTLLDCGPGTIRSLAASGIELRAVERVVFSHYHLDHCLDLFALAFARHNPSFQDAPEIELFGPIGLRRLVEAAPAALGHWASMPRAHVSEIEVDSEGRGSFEAGGLAFECVANGHNPEAVSWRIEPVPDPRPPAADRWSLAYTGDTPDEPRVAELAADVGLLVAECSFPDEEAVPNHLTPTSAGRLARAARARRLLLTHFYPALDPEQARERAGGVFDGPIELARDGSVHALAG